MLVRPQLLWLGAAASDETSADSISTAILGAFRARGEAMLERTAFIAFDPVHKLSRARVSHDGTGLDVVLGSPAIIAGIAVVPDDFRDQVDALGARGARVLTVAAGDGGRLVCQGLIALADSPREDARETIRAIQQLGIRVIMLTGDTAGTARAIAAQVGLGDRIVTVADALADPLRFDGFANVFPEDKYRIVQALQQRGMVVGMTGDGINDAPALKQADVGVAVSTATDVAKSAARVVLTEPTLRDITKVIEGGHRVYRRMMTWTITKLARTAELAALLTFGFIATGFFPVSLSLIVFIIVMNDLVTLTLGTDAAWPTQVPEQWQLPQLAKIAAIFTAGWLVLGLGLIGFFLHVQQLPNAQISSLMFVYLIYSAMETILMTRTREAFWSFPPSTGVSGMIAINVILATLMATLGWMMTAVSFRSVLAVLIATLLAMLVLDFLKTWYYRATGILGTEQRVAAN